MRIVSMRRIIQLDIAFRIQTTPHIRANGAKWFNRKDWSRPNNTCGHCGATQSPEGIGLEPTLAEHLENIVAMAREVRRVLRDDGSFWLNYGDAYANAVDQWRQFGVTWVGR